MSWGWVINIEGIKFHSRNIKTLFLYCLNNLGIFIGGRDAEEGDSDADDVVTFSKEEAVDEVGAADGAVIEEPPQITIISNLLGGDEATSF